MRVAAVAALVVVAVALLAFFLFPREPEFRMSGFPTQLSDEVVAVVNGYERRETDGDRVLYFIKADKATTFSDNHQELENVHLEVFDADTGRSDKITAQRSVYIPGDERDFTAYFAGTVRIETRDELKLATEQVTYRKNAETAEAEEYLEFERANIKGSTVGAIAKITEKRIELLRDVVVNSTAAADGSTGITASTTKAGFAAYDQATETIELRDNINGSFNSSGAEAPDTTVTAGRGNIQLSDLDGGQKDVARLDLYDNVRIDSKRGTSPTVIRSAQASYLKAADKFTLSNGATIETMNDGKASVVRGNEIAYERSRFVATVTGNGEVTQGTDLIRAVTIVAALYDDNSVRNAVARGSASIKQVTDERTTDVSAGELTADFDTSRNVRNAKASGSAVVVITPQNSPTYSRVTMDAPNSLSLTFRDGGSLEKLQTDGRTTVKLDAIDSGPDASNKVLKANSVRSLFHSDGQSMAKAEAEGNAELHVIPIKKAEQTYSSITYAPRFDCEFFETGSIVKTCVGATNTKTVRTPTVGGGRGVQTLTSERLTANFDRGTRDLDTLNAAGNAKFVELDRNAIADAFTFSSRTGIVMLRGGEPTVWDGQARVRANEIDWNTREQRSFFRDGVSTTYFSQRSSGGATPFSRSDKPVFLTANSAEVDHRTASAVYRGNARGWQDDNFIRADTLTLLQRDGILIGDGSVQSLLYDVNSAKRKDSPISASSARMRYERSKSLIRYEENVDIRQGPDRLTGAVANVHLNEKNEIERSDVEGSVVITQPNRRATGDYAQYTSVDERVVLRGNPASVSDAVNGSSQGGELVVFLRENRIIGTGSTKQNPTGRLRSVHKVKTN
jgi:LPS export ABC transporter protein LptC/lipopolysaccharide transport protein LptA